MKLAVALLTLLQATIVAADGTTCPSEDKLDKPFAGLTLNILGRSFGHSYFMSKVAEWEEMTGATVNVPIAATSGTELNELTQEDLANGANYYDGYIATNQNVPTLAHQMDPDTGKPLIMELDELVKNSVALDWPGIDVIFREYLCLYDNHVYTLPFDGDQFLLFYRRDLQEQDGWEVPKTWDELVAVAEQYKGQDLDGDGEEDYAICQPNQGDMAFYSLYAPLLGLMQTHHEDHEDVKSQIFPKRHGVFMDLENDGMAPLVDNAAMRRVMGLMKRIHELGQGEDLDLCCSTKSEGAEKNSGHGLFRTGKCAFYFSFPSVGTNSIVETGMNEFNETEYVYQHGRMGTALLPGWTEYLDRDTDTLEPCTEEECPSSTKLEDGSMLNTASWFANGGMGAVINGRVSDLKQRAAFNLFAFFSKDLTTTSAGMPYNPFRNPKHFQLDEYIEAGWDETDAQLYLDAIQKSLELPNAVMDLRVPYALQTTEDKRGFFRSYVHHFNELYRRMNEASGDEEEMDVMETVITELHEEIEEWIATHDIRIESSDTYWTGEIEEVYRRSMGLPLRAAPKVMNEVPIAVAASVLSVGAVLIIASGVYVMKTRQHDIFKCITGFFNPIAAAFFELTMLIFDISGDVLAYLLVVRKDENAGAAFKITYSLITALALGASLIAIVVGIVRIRQELGWFKKSERTQMREAREKVMHGTKESDSLKSIPAWPENEAPAAIEEEKEEDCEAQEPGMEEEEDDPELKDAEEERGRVKGMDDLTMKVANEDITKHEGYHPLDPEGISLESTCEDDRTQKKEGAEEELTKSRREQMERTPSKRMYKKYRKNSDRSLGSRTTMGSMGSFRSFASNVWLKTQESIRLHKGGAKTQLEFAEAFVNLLLLIFEDLPMAIMNIVYIMHISGGTASFTVLYMLSFAGGLVLLGFKLSKLREVEAFEAVVDNGLLMLSMKR